MNRERCQRYLEDPDAHRDHLAECAACREVFEDLDAKVTGRPVRLEALPLAPWEGAGYRAWPLVTGGALVVVAIAAALFAAAGELREVLPPADLVLSLLRLVGGAAQNAPGSWQIGIVVAFVAVNAVLIALLRRAPRGLDA
ncbi:MAG TPA: hypothetical protein VNA04_08175 [Thermoanaerobaculia bacterium]|nr:hypothetical protein [Thermoanaerobaculia bacterium]